MLKSSPPAAIRLRGVRHNNLKNFDLDLPLNQLIVITGLSGSGKSSLAFDTLFAEGQRRYIETFSPYARQFFDRMDKPQVDSIEGIPPAIAIEQRNAVRTTRSTVGTMTEVCDYMKMLWPHLAELHCRQCGQPVRKESPDYIWKTLSALQPPARAPAPTASSPPSPPPECLITFDLPLTEKLSLDESLALVAKQGYQRLLLEGQITRMEQVTSRVPRPLSLDTSLTVIQDRLSLTPANRPRFIEACEQAYHFGKGKLAIHRLDSSPTATGGPLRFSNRLHCAPCDLEYREPTPALFSFNHPVGACPTCKGFGRIISIDYSLALPDRTRTLAQGVVKPWQSGLSAECQADLLRMCRHQGIPTDVPFEKLARKWQSFVIEGEPGYGKDPEHEWPRAWYGIKGYFRWLESKAYKMHVRVLLSRYRAYTPCPACQGRRFQPETLLYRCGRPKAKSEVRSARSRTPGPLAPPQLGHDESLSLADFYQLPIRDAVEFIESLAASHRLQAHDPLAIVLSEVRSRLGFLNDVGLGYLTLDRATRTLSGGETERVNLTTCLGTRLVNTLFVLDEPSVGLHPRDTERLVRLLHQLRNAGNTVVVVEHEAGVIRAADQIVDLGPGHGATGGEVVFQGTYAQILKSKESLTGRYLSGRQRIEIPPPRSAGQASSHSLRMEHSRLASPSPASRSRTYRGPSDRPLVLRDFPRPLEERPVAGPALRLSHATRHNLHDLTVEIPLRRFVCITGVSGSGKTTLVREVLLPALTAKLKSPAPHTKASDRLTSDHDGEDDAPDSSPASDLSPCLEGWHHLHRVVLVDQSILGKTPRSNPAVYIGAFDDIREFFAQSELAKRQGLSASAFSFNSSQGQCERCRGAGFEKIEMQFLSDVFIRCPDCQGRRYRPHILDVKIRRSETESGRQETLNASPRLSRRASRNAKHGIATARDDPRTLSIADLLDSTIEEAIAFLSSFPESGPAQRAAEGLKLLVELGLGYLKLGQPINTLSGGESQRLKLVRHLAEAAVSVHRALPDRLECAGPRRLSSPLQPPSDPGPVPPPPTLFLFDEPTTGLHFHDIRALLKVFQRLVDAGHSVLVIEHNLDVIKCADWIIDLGPEAGDQGGRLVAQGTPADLAASPQSHTGRALRPLLNG